MQTNTTTPARSRREVIVSTTPAARITLNPPSLEPLGSTRRQWRWVVERHGHSVTGWRPTRKLAEESVSTLLANNARDFDAHFALMDELDPAAAPAPAPSCESCGGVDIFGDALTRWDEHSHRWAIDREHTLCCRECGHEWDGPPRVRK